MMKKIICIIFTCLSLLAVQAQNANSSDFGSEMVDIIRHMKTYTVAIANQMPEDKYDFKPTREDTVRSFAQQMKHIAVAVSFQSETLLNRKEFDPRETIRNFDRYENTAMTKTEIVNALSTSFDKLLAKLASMTEADFNQKYKLPFSGSDPKSLRVLTMFVRDHITHHRAQAIIYLRAVGIEPAFYQPF